MIRSSKRRALGAVLAAALFTGLAPLGAQAAPTGFSYQDRSDGRNRYETSVAVTRQWFPQPPAVTVYVASGENYPDALAAGAVAATRKAPVLLSQRGEMPSEVHKELTRLSPSRVVLLGGDAALSSRVEAQAKAVAASVERVAGTNRYSTAVTLARSFAPGVPVAYLASGRSFPDALAGAAAAGRQGGPVLLTEPGALTDVTAQELKRLGAQRIVVLGGTAAVSPAVEQAARTYGPVTRIAGANRYETAALVSGLAFPAAPTAYVASGENFPDALAGAARAGAEGAPVLLVRRHQVPAPVCREMKRISPFAVRALGGDAAVSHATLRTLGLRCPSPPPTPRAACTSTGSGGLDGAVARRSVEQALTAIRKGDAALKDGYGLAPALSLLNGALQQLAQAGDARVCQQAYYAQLLWEVQVDANQAQYDASIWDRSVRHYGSARAGLGKLLQMINQDLETSYRLP